MKPKNSKERKSGFLKFLLLFFVTTGTIVGAVYFNFKVPTRENDLLKEQAKLIDKEVEFQNEFSEKMANVKNLLDSLSVPGTNTRYINSLIGKELVDLQKTIPTKDDTYRYDMYTQIVTLYTELQDSKEKLDELKDSEGTIAEYKEALEKCRDDLKTAERELYVARNSR
ncbi:type VI secretion system transmembrane protein TssO [Cochleicola gelatinilyticus]|uniref:Type VI secretion system transmembrane protein TssO n=1 Tax=Cochleicola gelatinilyticus TaxID=1763537 RepID=A0A167HLZ8_9FLAO|nr:type VI secretion system transmembrane protein TssO [Cochleicola gelatinilyticus]OAB78753.1 hypothetical protein ULVI_09225 [Cochleicola gelatinilyticus]